MKKRKFLDWLESSGIQFRETASLKNLTWFQSGGTATAVIYPATISEFVDILKRLAAEELPFRVIGETSNMLFLDEVTYGYLLSTVRLTQVVVHREHKEIVAECGFKLPDLSRLALLESAAGFGGLEGIPGTVGGAVFMNAGAYGDSIMRVLKSVEVVTGEGKFLSLNCDELDFSYRNSVFRDGRCPHYIVRARFHLRFGNPVEIASLMETVHSKRHKYNDYCYPNLGSIFAGSIYRALAKRDKTYWLVSSLFYFFNYRCKLFRRESPINRKWLNDFTVKRFGIAFEKQPFSDKTMNSIINNGQHTRNYLEYIEQIQQLIHGDVPIENEIVEEF